MASTAEFQRIPLDKLSLYHQNARRGDVAAIAESLTVNGQYAPITVNLGTHTGRPYEVLAGNHTTMSARYLGWTEIDCYVVDVDEQAATRINLSANKLTQLGGFDQDALNAQLASLGDIAGTGFTQSEIDALLTPPELPAEPVDYPEPPAEQQAEPAPKSSDESVQDAPGPRSISLSGLPPRYLGWIQDQLTGIKEANEMESYADVLVMLVMVYTGDRPSADGHEDLTGA